MVRGLARRHTIGSDSVRAMMVAARGVDFHRRATPAGQRHSLSVHLGLMWRLEILTTYQTKLFARLQSEMLRYFK